MDSKAKTEKLKALLKIPFVKEQMIYRLENINPAKNAKKFYELWIKPTKDMRASLVAVYGRIGSKGTTKVKLPNSSESACRIEAENVLEERIKREYVIVEFSGNNG
jgi:predicted DNA-binding WGR domain protein